MAATTTAEVQQLQEDNEYLETKVRYVQSIATIFRQKIGLLVKEMLSGRNDGPELNNALDSMLNELNQADQVHGETYRQNASGENKNANAENNKTSLATDGAEYWREQFLSLMRDTKPSTLQDAQALCDILQEKNAISIRESALKKEYLMLEQRHHALKVQFKEVVEAKALGADDAVKELYKSKLAEIEASTNVEAIQQRMEQIAELKKENAHLISQAKLLRMRAMESKNRLHDAVCADKGTDSTQSKMETLSTKINDQNSIIAALDAELRHYKGDLYKAQEECALREQATSRVSGKAEALEIEAEYALRAGIADVDSQQVMFLQRQFDTFELHIRRLEAANKDLTSANEDLTKKNEDLSLIQVTLEGQTNGLRSSLGIKEKTIADLKLDKEQREAHRESFTKFETDMNGKVDELNQIHCVREMKAQIAKVEGDFDKVMDKNKIIENLEGQVKALKDTLELFRDELTRCSKFGDGKADAEADIKNLESHIIGNLNLPEGIRKTPLIREITLRTEDDWREVRDTVSGKVRYVKNSAIGTPFEPKPPKEKEATPPESPKSEKPLPDTDKKKKDAKPAFDDSDSDASLGVLTPRDEKQPGAQTSPKGSPTRNSPKKEEDSSAPKCKNGHPVNFEANLPLSSHGPPGGWTCDACLTRDHHHTEGSYRCPPCDFDMCKACWDRLRSDNLGPGSPDSLDVMSPPHAAPPTDDSFVGMNEDDL